MKNKCDIVYCLKKQGITNITWSTWVYISFKLSFSTEIFQWFFKGKKFLQKRSFWALFFNLLESFDKWIDLSVCQIKTSTAWEGQLNELRLDEYNVFSWRSQAINLGFNKVHDRKSLSRFRTSKQKQKLKNHWMKKSKCI